MSVQFPSNSQVQDTVDNREIKRSRRGGLPDVWMPQQVEKKNTSEVGKEGIGSSPGQLPAVDEANAVTLLTQIFQGSKIGMEPKKKSQVALFAAKK